MSIEDKNSEDQESQENLVATLMSLIPKTTPVGTSVLLMDLTEAVKFFPNQNHARLLKIFKCLRIPLIYDQDRISFNLYTLEKVLHYITRPGGQGIALFGSKYRDITRYDHRTDHREDRVLIEMGDSEIAEMNSVAIESARFAGGPKANLSSRQAYLSALKEKEKSNKPIKETKPKKRKTVPQ